MKNDHTSACTGCEHGVCSAHQPPWENWSDTEKVEWHGRKHPVVEFQGERYYLNVTLGYYQTKQYKKLHRAIWEGLNGPVPDGFLVHHIDEDKTSNDPSNLGLMKWGEHTAHHKKTGKTMATRPCAWCDEPVTREATTFRRCIRPFCNRTCHMLYRNRVLQLNPLANVAA